MTVVYLDSVFTLNTLMDYLLCLATARLAGIPLRRGRYLLAALAGGAYAAAVFWGPCWAAPSRWSTGFSIPMWTPRSCLWPPERRIWC